MKTKKTDHLLNKYLKHGKSSKLGLFEKSVLWISGRKDGRHGLPGLNASGEWDSPVIKKELNGCNESHNKLLGLLHICLDEKFESLEILGSELVRLENKKDMLVESIPVGPEKSEIRRNYGEDKLSDSQVYQRRLREYQKRIRGKKEEIKSIEDEIDEICKELIETKAFINQKTRQAEFACERIRCHTQQRIDQYWKAAVYSSYDTERQIPSVYARLALPDVVNEYKTRIAAESEKVENLLSQYGLRMEVA